MAKRKQTQLGRSVIRKRNGQEEVLSHLSQLLQTHEGSDVDFIIKGEKIPGHTAIIRGGSPVLASMFDLPMTEKANKRVKINDISPNVFRQLLSYLYIGNAPNLKDEEITEQLFTAADKYQITSLKKWCSHVLGKKKLNVDNAVRLLVLSHLHSDDELKEDVRCFLAKNSAAMWERDEFQQLCLEYPELFYEFTKRMFRELTSTPSVPTLENEHRLPKRLLRLLQLLRFRQ